MPSFPWLIIVLTLNSVSGKICSGILCLWAATSGNVPSTREHSEDSDQPAHSRSLIKIFTGQILDSQWSKVSSCGQRRLWSDCADAQADLSLRWAHGSEGTFSDVAALISLVMPWTYGDLNNWIVPWDKCLWASPVWHSSHVITCNLRFPGYF